LSVLENGLGPSDETPMRRLIRSVCQGMPEHFRTAAEKLIAEDPKVAADPELQAVARGVANEIALTYERVLGLGVFEPGLITITANSLRDCPLWGKENRYRYLICPQYLGLCNAVAPKMVIVGVDQAFNVQEEVASHNPWINFVLESLYLPLLHLYRSAGTVIAHIADKREWTFHTLPFVDDPSRYYGKIHHAHFWYGANLVMQPQGGWTQTYITDRNIVPSKAICSNPIRNSCAADAVAALRDNARVLIFSGDYHRPLMRQIAAAFWGRPTVRPRDVVRPTKDKDGKPTLDPLWLEDYDAEGRRRLLVTSLFLGGGNGLTSDLKRDLGRRIQAFLDSLSE